MSLHYLNAMVCHRSPRDGLLSVGTQTDAIKLALAGTQDWCMALISTIVI